MDTERVEKLRKKLVGELDLLHDGNEFKVIMERIKVFHLDL